MLHKVDWTQARCLGMTTDLFVGIGEGVSDDPVYPPTEAKAICSVCPIQAECLTYALDQPWTIGVWGGTSTYQRELLRRNRKRLKCPSCSGVDTTHRNGAQHCLCCGTSWPDQRVRTR